MDDRVGRAVRGRMLAAPAVGLSALLMAGCAVPTPNAASKTPLSADSVMGTPSSLSTVTTAPGIASVTPNEEPVDAEPTRESGVEVETLAVANEAVTAFCRPTLAYDSWIAELYPFLSQQAAVAYETVDPANVPCTTPTGAATVRDGDGAFTMRIIVPTDAGEYSVYVHRSTESTPWAVEQIIPLASE